jgi:plastocyanin
MHRVRRSSIAAVVIMSLGLMLAACGGDDDDSGGSASKTAQAKDGRVTVVGRDTVYDVDRIEAPPGSLQVTLENEGVQQHTFTVDDPKVRVLATPGNTASGTISGLEAGTYEYYCDIPGHKATMHGTLVVK